MSSSVVSDSGCIPYVTAGETNNAVSTYICYDEEQIEKGNSIMIGGKTLVITYQPKDYFSNDSHNLSLYLHNGATANKYTQLFLVATLSKSLKPRYTRGDSVSKKKIQSDVFLIPVRNQEVDFEFMETFIRAVEKLVIKDLILRSDKKMSAYNKVVKG